ncbi:MAG: DUF378 domain-containing protein [Clostridia bacterium]|nr:DUF378 domain-containing protein [Clostridia bacterium]
MKKVMQVVDVIAFSLLLLGGLNYLMAGIFGLDLMHLMFGANISIVGRVVYSIIGLSALLLLVTIVARAVMKNKQSN